MHASIRHATPDDAPGVLAIYAPIVQHTPISFELTPPTTDEIRRRMADITQTYPWLVCEVGGQIAGYAYASRFRARPAYDWSAETTVYTHEQHRGRRIGLALYTALIALLRAQHYRLLIGGITIPNAASVALHERAGFRFTGEFPRCGWKFNAWHTVGFWQMDLGHDDDPPRPLVAAPVLANTAAWTAAIEVGTKVLTPSARRA